MTLQCHCLKGNDGWKRVGMKVEELIVKTVLIQFMPMEAIMHIDHKVRLLKNELRELKGSVGALIADEESRSYLRYEERERVEEIFSALYEDIQVLEKGAEVVSLILTGIEN